MRRQCNEYEKEVLYNNRKDIFSSTFEAKHGNGAVPVLVGVFVGIAISIPVALSLELKGEHSIKVLMLAIIAVTIAATQFVFKKFGAKGDKNKVFKDNQVEINGATVIGVNYKDGYFIYIEDDFYDSEGKFQRITMPLKDYGKVTYGMRIMALRTVDGEYFLMTLSDETRNMIPAYGQLNLQDPNAINTFSYGTIPHPNAVYMDPYPRLLSYNEKEALYNSNNAFNKKNEKVGVFCFAFLQFLFAFLAFVGLVGSETISEPIPVLILAVGLIAACIIFTVLFKRFIRKKASKNMNSDIYVQRVLLESHTFTYVGYVAQQTLRTYEYVNGVMSLQTYANSLYNEKNPYGTILYKYTIGKTTYFTSKMFW